jgi:hypothetical protein
MRAGDPLASLNGIVLRAPPRPGVARLPLALALPLIAGLSVLLWMVLLHLAALLV